MAVVIYWGIKILLWGGLIFSLYSIFKPDQMLKLTVKAFECKMKWFGMKGHVEPAANAKDVTRIWSAVLVLIFIGIIYFLCNAITIGCVLKS